MTKRMILTKNALFLAGMAILMVGCDSKQREQLQTQVDSLKTELSDKQQLMTAIQDIGSMIDSIDARREVLNANMVEGTTYDDYADRLASINRYMRETESKIADMEGALKKSSDANSWYAKELKRLKGDLESRSEQLTALQQEVESMREKNDAMAQQITEQDELLAQRLDSIQVKDANIRSMETRLGEVEQASQETKAELYFSYAQAMETAADRTHFARRKKLATQRKALELYKVSLSLGKEEAQPKIQELEDDLS